MAGPHGGAGGDPAAVASRVPRPRMARAFSSAADEKRARRPTDILMLVCALAGLLGLSMLAPGPTDFDESVTELLSSLPGVAGWAWRAFFALISIWTVLLVVLAAARRERRILLRDYALAALLAVGAALLASLLAGTSASELLDAFITPQAPPHYLGLRIALCTAVVAAASPHLAHWLRFVGRGLLLLGGLSAVVLGVDLPIGATAGFLVGLAAAAITHLVLGSPGGRPTRAAVAEGLADLGIGVHTVVDEPLDLSGAARFLAEGDLGTRLGVKAYGRDAWDGQLLTSTWEALWRTGRAPDLSAGRLARAEHEALATLLAERSGASVLPLVAVGITVDADVLVVTRAGAGPALVPDASDDRIAETWSALDALHAAGLAHGSIGTDTVVLDDKGRVALTDLAAARLAAESRPQRIDEARLLVGWALEVGPDRALAAAQSALGPEGLQRVLPFLQPAALGSDARRGVRLASWGMRDLLKSAADLTGEETPDPERLARVSVGGLVKLVLLGMFGYWIVGMVSGVDWSQVAQAFRDADLALLAGALVLSPTVQVWLSLATLGATLVVLRYGPVLMLQYAIQFVGLVVPSSAARVALEVRFFTGWGMGAGPAMFVGVIDSVMGFAVQMVLIVIVLLTGLVGFAPPAESTSSSSTTSDSGGGHDALLVIAAVLAAAVLATALFPALRHQARVALPRFWLAVRTQLTEARGSLAVLRKPGKIGLMVLGNLGAQLTQALILGICLAAFGQHVSFAGLVLVNTGVSLFAGFMPVPGGMGVAEAGFTAGLVALGVPSDIALSTALMFRMVTFYLPPLWGVFAMKWLHRREYV